MAKPELIVSVNVLSKKIDRLMALCKSLENRCIELEENNKQLLRQHREDSMLIQKANKEIEFLSLSHRLADSPKALVDARAVISKLIKNIDNCIRILKED